MCVCKPQRFSRFWGSRVTALSQSVLAVGATVICGRFWCDLCDDLAHRVSEVERHCPCVPILVTSALRAEGIDAVRGCVRGGMTVALVGSSGAGKSTLVNGVLGERLMRP